MITYKIAEQNDLNYLVKFLEDPSIDTTFVSPLSQRPVSIHDRVYKKFNGGYWILAKDSEVANNGSIVGCLALVPNKDEIEISTYAVAESCRGKGIGSALIDESVKVTLEKYPECRTLILDSWEGNPAIERIMDKKGFALREAFEDPAKRPPGIKTVVYAKQIRD